MPVDNNQFSDTLNIKGRNNISQYCFLCFITRMDTKRKFPLSRILRPHADRWHDHTIYPIFLFGYQSGRNRYIMRKDTIRHIGQMQIMRFGSPPR